MAFADLGDRGGATSKASGTTLSASPSSNVNAGEILVVYSAWDNNNASSPDAPWSVQIGCSDSKGNVWHELFSGQDTGANARSHGSIFVCFVQTAILTTDTVTLTNGTSAKVAKAMTMRAFSMSAGAVLGLDVNGQTWALTRGAAPASLTLASMTSRAYLLLHLLAVEGPSTDTFTEDANYTAVTSRGTSGGTADTNQTVNGGFRIATLTGDTNACTYSDNTRDNTGALCALFEYTAPFSFPTTGVLDNFNRADVNPVPAPPWSGVGAGTTAGLLQNLGNAATRSSTGNNGEWWGTNFAVSDEECFATFSALWTSNGQVVSIMASGNGSGPGGRSTAIVTEWHKGLTGGAPANYIFHGAAGAASISPLYLVTWASPAAGDKIGVRTTGDMREYWWDRGSGWVILAAVDAHGSATAANGYLGATTSDTVARLDDFGGGAVISPLGHLLPILGVGS